MRITSTYNGGGGPFIDYDPLLGPGAYLYVGVARAIVYHAASGARKRELRRVWRALRPASDAPADPTEEVGRIICDLVDRATHATSNAIDNGVLDANPANMEAETWYALLLQRVDEDAMSADHQEEDCDPSAAVAAFVIDVDRWFTHCSNAIRDQLDDVDDDSDDDSDSDDDDSDKDGGGGD